MKTSITEAEVGDKFKRGSFVFEILEILETKEKTTKVEAKSVWTKRDGTTHTQEQTTDIRNNSKLKFI